MSILTAETNGGKVLEILVSGRFSADDYNHLVPEVERLINLHGKMRIVFEMFKFRGWELGAVWEDIKFDFKHFADIDRLAVIGDRKWQEWMPIICRPFTTAAVRCFERGAAREARRWVLGN